MEFIIRGLFSFVICGILAMIINILNLNAYMEVLQLFIALTPVVLLFFIPFVVINFRSLARIPKIGLGRHIAFRVTGIVFILSIILSQFLLPFAIAGIALSFNLAGQGASAIVRYAFVAPLVLFLFQTFFFRFAVRFFSTTKRYPTAIATSVQEPAVWGGYITVSILILLTITNSMVFYFFVNIGRL